MVWSLLFAMAMTTATSVKLSKGAFVGAFTANGQAVPVSSPSDERWVSSEQVQREILFRGWKAPLTSAQLAEVAKGLEANFAADVFVSLNKTKGKYRLLAVLRCVSASFESIVHLSQEQAILSSLEEFPQTVDEIAQKLLAKIPAQIPIATVQLRESEKRVHLTALGGEWKRGLKLLFLREIGRQIVLIGEGQIVAANLPVGGNRWLLEAELKLVKDNIRAGDKAIQVFKLPRPFDRWQ